MPKNAPGANIDDAAEQKAREDGGASPDSGQNSGPDSGQNADQKGAAPCRAAVEALIRKRVYAAIAIGFVPVPLVDFLGLSALQLEMIHSLAAMHGVEFKKELAKSIISSLCGGALTTASVPLAASIFKSIPLIGSTAGAATVSIMGGAATYALGCVFDRHFSNGGTLLNFDVQESKAYFKSRLEEGKALAGRLKKAVKNDGEAAGPADA